MEDIIHLLPDVVANQIAAGEVVQRPASAVKELIENAIDAGATNIQLIIKDAGRTLIQVVDNGKGMSFSDARLCFERHATSKITSSQDLFSLTTKGFRGEALASIAAIAQVELKTKPENESIGTLVVIEGSQIKEQIPVATQNGTSFSVKNIFFNVPARRNFLKSDTIELGHIEEEFFRIALIHSNISFSFYNNGKLITQLIPSNFYQRIVNLMGTHFKEKLYPVEQLTDTIKISGFVAKPENAKKKKSEQYLFINNRYVKHYLLTHAVEAAYKELIPDGYKPAFFIKIDVDPATIDVNISPTKIEVKLQDERLIYGFLNAAVKKSLGTLSLTPQLDFESDRALEIGHIDENRPIRIPTATCNPNYNPFHSNTSHSEHSSKPDQSRQIDNWSQFLSDIKNTKFETKETELESALNFEDPKEEEENAADNLYFSAITFSNKYLVYKTDKTLAIIDIARARERILYEKYMTAFDNTPIVIQQSLFPETITLSGSAADLAKDLKPDLYKLGYDLEPIDSVSFAVNGTPTGEDSEDLQSTIENLISTYQSHQFLYKSDRGKNLATCLAKQKRSHFSPINTPEAQKDFVHQLFNSSMPTVSPSGKKIIHLLTEESLGQFFA